ncbi:MAG: hypothetical protein RJB11_3404 [Planctomycetota bacterium]|jgi:hypothetical protein
MRDLIFEPMPLDAKYKNYCSWDYTPLSSGTGKLRPSSLLFLALSDLPYRQFLCQAIEQIQSMHGLFESVYGIKRIGERWSLEVYVYDYERTSRTRSWNGLFGGKSGVLSSSLQVRESTPYFMFSFDLDEQVASRGGSIDTAHLYIGNPGSMVSSGIAYRQDASGLTLENFYFFFDARSQQQEITDKMTESVFWDVKTQRIEELLLADLKECDTICLANKPKCDTIYFSGIHIQQLIRFCEWQNYPQSFVEFLLANEFQLDHLKYDVGLDYCWKQGQLQCLKSGIYGAF